jgi:hypothetical protein
MTRSSWMLRRAVIWMAPAVSEKGTASSFEVQEVHGVSKRRDTASQATTP